jgi:hypothetical protein
LFRTLLPCSSSSSQLLMFHAAAMLAAIEHFVQTHRQFVWFVSERV